VAAHIIRIMKRRRVRMSGCVSVMEEMRMHAVYVGKPERKLHNLYSS
jgi:hypothetical protein